MKLSIGVDEELFEWLREVADQNHRSVAGQVRFFLDRERQTKTDNTKEVNDENGDS